MITITLPDGSKKEYEKGTTGLNVAQSIAEGLARAACAARINGELCDLTKPIEEDCDLEILKFDDEDGKYVFRHSSAHLMAAAILKLFPDAKFGVGPPVEEGFYYDIDVHLTEEDLPKIEAEMKKIVEEKVPFTREFRPKKEALEFFKRDELKCELIDEKGDEQTSLYVLGDFYDFCRGPHLPHAGKIKAFKIIKLAGAYWKGDAKNRQLTRIYGISFPDKKQLKEYLHIREEAAKRDHRKIGKEQELFMFHDYSPGSPFFLPKGTIMYNELLKLIREEYKKRGYEEVITPQVFNKKLWETSGHWAHYKDDMFAVTMDGQEASLKPMNCPSHCLIYKSKKRSYNDLPWRVADFCCLHRNELKGVLGGLTRVRKFSQDDAHIFCTEKDIQSEVSALIDFVRFIYADVFGFTYKAKLSTKPEKAMGDPETWVKAEDSLREALEANGINFEIKPGEGAFYGPKIDFDIKDSLGREWQTATIQLDFQMPKNFELEYMGNDGTENHQPVMIHRAILGSLERFVGVMIEHFGGKFPLWISPEQVRILTVADRLNDHAKQIQKQMSSSGLRAELDLRAESIPKKVREAQLDQVNYIIVIGDKEKENGTINVRTRDNIVHGEKKVDEFITELQDEINSRKL